MKQLEQRIYTIIKHRFDREIAVDLTRPDSQYGDWATNAALQLATSLGKNPRDIAAEIASQLTGEEIKKTEVAGPGFINMWLSDTALARETQRLPQPRTLYKTIVIETNNPNPFKAMHIGHAFNAILADTIANLLDLSETSVHRVSYHGDIGAHVGKSMYSLLRYCDGSPMRLMEIPETERNSFMSRMYADGARAYDENDATKAKIDHLAQLSFTLGDPMYKKIYEIVKNWSFDEIDSIVSRLGNKPIEKRYLESQADARGVKTVKAHTPTVFKHSDGAYVFEGSKYGTFDNVFVASNGRGLYGARDLGLMQLKYDDFKPDKSYIATAEEQRDYFKGVIAAAELCLPEMKDVTVNIAHGTVKLTTGKMSSRKGDVLEIGWLFDQIGAAIEARGGKPNDELIAGALRYQFLKVRVGGNVVFDVNEAVSLHGNSGPYLQYAHARASSILEKATGKSCVLHEVAFEENERVLVQKMSEYADIVELAFRDLLPHHICHYLYELAQEFNRFYEAARIIGDPRESERLAIVGMYRDILARGLAIIGIHAPEVM
jgi:arginyl-tRNA synthetase